MNADGTESTCLNCGGRIDKLTFCGACGQPVRVRRLSWVDIVRSVRDHVFDGDLPWLRTFRELWLDTGGVARRFNEGRRIAYVHPLKYAFYALAIYSILSVGADAAAALPPDIPFWRRELATNLPLFMLLVSPVMVLTLRACFFRHPINAIETWVLVLYVLGQLSFLILAIEIVDRYFIPEPIRAAFAILVAFGFPLVFFMASVARFYRTRLDYALIGALVSLTATAFASVYLQGWLHGWQPWTT